MDRELVLDELSSFLELLEKNRDAHQRRDQGHPSTAELQSREPIIRRLFDAIDPVLNALTRSRARTNLDWRWRMWPEATRKAIALVERHDDIDRMLGDGGPKLSVDQLHPLVWDAARLLYKDGHYREAVRNAAEAFNGYIRARIGISGLSGKTLVEQAYSSATPTEDRPRLRPPHNLDSETRTSLEEGARSFGAGIMQLVRNTSTHVEEEWSEQVAAELLAALSVFARRIDDDHVEEVEGCTLG